jgi:mono/diheme cytochrome c family protein
MRKQLLGKPILLVLVVLGVSAGFALLTSTVRAADSAAAKKVFTEKCAKCHGDSGNGQGRMAKMLKKKPADWTNKAEMAKFTDAKLKQAILEGMRPMPGYKGKLDDKTIDDLVAYIRTFAK